MSWQDYLAALYGGQTGTNDPSAGGFSFPSLIGSAQAAEAPMPRPMPFGGAPNVSPEEIARLLQSQQPSPQPPAGGDPGMVHGGAPGYSPPSVSSMFQGAFGRSPAQAIQNGLFGAVPPPPIPGPMNDPPVQAPLPPPIPGPQMQRGGAQVLARLYNPEPMQAPGGGSMADAGVSTLGPPPLGSPYAMLQDAARRAQMAGQPSPPPIPPPFQQPPQAAPQAAQQASGIGSNIQSHINELRSNPDFQRIVPPSTKPSIWDNLMRFGFAAMAAGGKPMATTLGALGEAGMSTFDANQKSKQSDFENAIAAKKAGVSSQSQISVAYERLDKLLQQSQDTRLSIEQRAEAQREARKVQLDIATMTNQTRQDIAAQSNETRQDALAERQRNNDLLAGDREQKREEAAARQAETAQQHAAEYYRRQRDAAEKVNPLGVTPETELRITRDTAKYHPNSVFAKEWEGQKAIQLNDARSFIQLHPAEKPKAIEKLRKMGIDPREL